MTSMPIASASASATRLSAAKSSDPASNPPSTCAGGRLIAAVRAAVAAGIPLEELRSLRDLLRPDRVEIIIEYYWEKNGEKPSLYTIDLASKLLALARSEASPR